jgi:uncharacterized protein
VAEADWTGHEEALEAAYQALADWYIDEARKSRDVPLEITHLLLQNWHRHLSGGERQTRPCGVGSWVIGVDPDGHVLPCHRWLYRKHEWLGNVDQPVLDAKRRAPFLQVSSRAILGCDTCPAEPVCGGGCRAVVVNAGLDLQTGAHPGYCLNTRAHARAARRIYDTLMAEDNRVFRAVLRGQRPLNPSFTELITR